MIRHRLDPTSKRGLPLTLIVLAALILAIPFGLVLLEVLFSGPLTEVDQRVADQQNSYNLRDHDAVYVARIVTQLGSTVLLAAIVVLVAVYLVVARRRRRHALFLIGTASIGVLLNNGIKVVVGRSRPHFDNAVAHAFGKSFPSGHAMNSTVVYGALLVLAWPPLHSRLNRVLSTIALATLVSSIAASRVVLTVHYPSDVIAGVALGAALVLASAAAFTVWQRNDGFDLPTGERDDQPFEPRSTDHRNDRPG